MNILHGGKAHYGWTGLVSLALTLLLPLSAVAFTGNPNAKPGAAPEPVYEVTVDYGVKIAMPDGTLINADVYRPNAPGSFPVIVEGMPYGTATSTELAYGSHEFFPPRGYIFMTWDARGIWGSDGEFELHATEKDDAYHVIDWIAQQNWCNGEVLLVGNSYGGQTVFWTAIAQHPAVKLATPFHTSDDLYRNWYYRGGALEFGFTSPWTTTRFAPVIAERLLEGQALTDWQDTLALYNADMEYYSLKVPTIEFEPAFVTDDWNQLVDWIEHPVDSEWWWQRNPGQFFHEITIPMMHLGGWYDIFLDGTFRAFRDIQFRAPNAHARDNQRLVIGPWAHGGLRPTTKTDVGEIDYGPIVQTPTMNELRLSFFEYWLKDNLYGYMQDNPEPIRIFVMGENVWRGENEWPPARVVDTPYYFNDKTSGSSADSLYDGSLSVNLNAAGTQPVTYAYDPMDPIASRGGSKHYGFVLGEDGDNRTGPVDQRPVEIRSINFTTDPLSDELEITGKVRAFLYASSDCVDTDFIVRVSDVYPDGTSLNIVEGVQRARFRSSSINPTLLEPGEVYLIEVDLWETSHVFLEGHRIRVTVNSSSFPRWSRNMNVAEQPELATEWKVANNTIYLDPERPSHVLLPVIPR